MKKPHTEEQIIGILRLLEKPGVVGQKISRQNNISDQTFYR